MWKSNRYETLLSAILGHTVFGVECSKDGIVDFFDEDDLEYEEILKQNGKDYAIHEYRCSNFKLYIKKYSSSVEYIDN